VISFIVKLLVEILRDVLAMQSHRGSVSNGSTPLSATPKETLLERGRRSGLLLFIALLPAFGCGQTEVIVATLHPVEDATKGWPRVAQDEVRVILDGSGRIGVVRPAAGYFLVHESDLKGLLRGN